MRQLLCIVVFLGVALWLSGQSLASEATMEAGETSIDFLYVNANAGEAAGGHSALRLGDAVFHYQFFPDSTFLLVRDSWDSFRFLYNDLHNRSIAIAALPLNLPATVQVRNHFTELLAIQEQFFNDLEWLRREERFLQRLVAGESEISVESLGFFRRKQVSGIEVGLVEQIERVLSVGFLQKAVVEAEEDLQLAVSKVNGGEMRGDIFLETLTLYEALRVLVEGRVLEEGALLCAMKVEQALSPDEKKILGKFSDHLAKAIVQLLQSARPDRGAVILLQTARYQAVQHSLATGQLLTLDPFFDGVRVVALTDEDIADRRLAGLQTGMLNQSVKRRKLFFKEEHHPEIAYSLMETSRAMAWELLQVNDTSRQVRILAKATVPTRPGIVNVTTLHVDRIHLQGKIKLIEEQIAEQHKKSEELYGYNLFTRNCATELIRSLNSTFPDAQSGEKTLGGWLEPDSGLAFIPFLFYEQSLHAFSIQDEEFLQARRLRNLDTMYSKESDLLVWLRESNTLSSTLYQSRSKDTPFLFFTDDSFVLRPVLGLANVAYGAVHGVAGIAAFPFDGGAHLNQALRGIFYSLPELAFGNIRKGSYPVGESESSQKTSANPGKMQTSY